MAVLFTCFFTLLIRLLLRDWLAFVVLLVNVLLLTVDVRITWLLLKNLLSGGVTSLPYPSTTAGSMRWGGATEGRGPALPWGGPDRGAAEESTAAAEEPQPSSFVPFQGGGRVLGTS
eukprot:GHVT01010906.1.p1 GENE.GHVT01010906.1~~GHVT01010906.1.p1  ORF type:complete len:117 (+),score=17.00 GHVT01010906.1:708-1058(+)